MITPPETMFIILCFLFINMVFITWMVYSSIKEMRDFPDFVNYRKLEEKEE